MVEIHLISSADIEPIAKAFAKLGWHKPASQYQEYLSEQEIGQRVVLVATIDNVFAGYVTILWDSVYLPFREDGIPEIVDFNVLPKFRRQGIGTQLMDEAEHRIAKKSSFSGIGVGLTEDYGAAQILYNRRGYIPDGRGVSWNGKLCHYGDRVSVDDDLVIHFTRRLKQSRSNK